MNEQYQPKTGEPCTCRKGFYRNNCAMCEGTGWKIDFKAIRARADAIGMEIAEKIIQERKGKE